ncbi:MAG: AAA family ATPase [Pseudomonadota bacterium]
MTDLPPPMFPKLEVTSISEFYGKPVPERRWLVRDVFPLNTVSIVSGPGGIGKSGLLYQLCISVSLGMSFIGREVTRGRALYLTCEDDLSELNIRADEIARGLGICLAEITDVDVFAMVGGDSSLGKFDKTNKLTPTFFFYSLFDTVDLRKYDLVVLDNVADLFAGNENDRVQVKAFVKLLASICETNDCTVILVAHPSVSGMAEGSGRSGSTGWPNAVRSFWYLKRPDDRGADRDLRELANQKANRGPDGETIILRREKGIYRLEGGGSFLDLAAHRSKVRQVFLSLYRQKRALNYELTSTQSRTGAVTVFASDPEAGGIKKHDFEVALRELINDGTLKLKSVGPPSKTKTVIVWPEEVDE